MSTTVPTVVFPPVIPFTSHEMLAPAARQNVAANVCVCPSVKLAVAGEIALVRPQVIVTLALADFVLSATLVTVTVTLDGVGTFAGAVNNAVVELVAATVPIVAFPPDTPFTLHITSALSLPVPLTAAVNSCAPPAGTLAIVGAIMTAIAGGDGGGELKPAGVPAVPQPWTTIAIAPRQIAKPMSHPGWLLRANRVELELFTCAVINARAVPLRSSSGKRPKSAEFAVSAHQVCSAKSPRENRVGHSKNFSIAS
ncbi:MAG: hypothetical protein WBQ34_12555 [Candidatus Acidiferrales bacterium]